GGGDARGASGKGRALCAVLEPAVGRVHRHRRGGGVRLTVERLGHLGDGIARGPDGTPVFVPMALPGEVVEGEVADGRMEGAKIVTPSPDRVRPPCPHYRACGGCALMHASDAFVARWKEDVVRSEEHTSELQSRENLVCRL